MVYFFMLLQPMRLSPTGTVRGQLRFYGTRDSSIPISNPTMGTDIIQFCHERLNISFSPEIKKSQSVLFFVMQTWSLYYPWRDGRRQQVAQVNVGTLSAHVANLKIKYVGSAMALIVIHRERYWLCRRL